MNQLVAVYRVWMVMSKTATIVIHVNVWTPQELNKEQRMFFEAQREESNFHPDPDKNNKSFFDRVKEMFQ